MFDLENLPYDAFCKLQGTHSNLLVDFRSSGYWEIDIKSGKANSLIYWFHYYSSALYDEARQGHQWRIYLDSFNENNSRLFEDIFTSTAKNLDRLEKNPPKQNHLGEVTIKRGKI